MAFFDFEQRIIDVNKCPWGFPDWVVRVDVPESPSTPDDVYYVDNVTDGTGNNGVINEVWVNIPINDDENLNWYWYDPITCRVIDYYGGTIMQSLKKIQIFFDGTKALEFDLRIIYEDGTWDVIESINSLDEDNSIYLDISEHVDFDQKVVEQIALYNVTNNDSISYWPDQIIGVFR